MAVADKCTGKDPDDLASTQCTAFAFNCAGEVWAAGGEGETVLCCEWMWPCFGCARVLGWYGVVRRLVLGALLRSMRMSSYAVLDG